MALSSDSCGSESPCWDVRSSFGVMLSPMVVRLRHYRCLVEAQLVSHADVRRSDLWSHLRFAREASACRWRLRWVRRVSRAYNQTSTAHVFDR
jgi:hypothetical protein